MIFKKPIFWNDINFISLFFLPLSVITFIINYLKKFKIKKNFKIRSICIGNLYIGGTGKTPLAISVNNILKKKFKTTFVKKKYSNQIDEQNILKKYGSLLCYNYRDVALKIAEKKRFEVAILDDGLQDKSINYNLTIACFNSKEGIGNGFLIPAGPLRENISEIKNYDAVFLNGEKKNIKLKKKIKNIKPDMDIFEANYIPKNIKNFNLKKNFLIFSGIGNPEEFERTLIKYKFKIKQKFFFPDHYKYSSREINNLKKIAQNKKLDILTTEKDYLRLNNKDKKGINFLKIELVIKNRKNFIKFLSNNI